MRDGTEAARQPPSVSHRFTVLREQPSSAAIRFVPQPQDRSASIADTSSGVRISTLPTITTGEETAGFSSLMEHPLGQRGQFLMSPRGQFSMSPDTATEVIHQLG
ncbi:hypothetical protein [Frigidibacter sp. MR17.24]|uniref:hypothetical protein n=1 Tax=Frigidibacter sp. MR17.24 TaxID=3127345 RepID=UPI003012E08F